MDVQEFLKNAVVPWLETHGLAIALIIIGALIVRKVIFVLIERLIRRTIRSNNKVAEEKRENTLVRVADATVRVLLVIVTLLMILSELGVNIGPLLAAAGVAGIAVGFGGQYLIRDVITGLFILLENQYRVGDVACFDGTCGLVEDISLRVTTLRDLDGTVHHVPHGEIKKVSNLTKEYACVNLNVGVAYNSDLEKVIAVVNKIGEELATDPAWKEAIITAPKFLRVEEFADSAIIIKILGDTQPIKQWDVAGELRKRLKVAFDREGIEIPFPQRTIHQA